VTGQGPILFFDGVCTFCNRSVDWVMRRDRQRLFRMASLQGETAKRLVPEAAEDLNSFVLWQDGVVWKRSDAAIRVLVGLGVPGAKILALVPRGLRDFVYALVAKNRYRWFGKRESCRLPTADERSRFLP
jgi:predicted DCC family thiol-disulfide oxidoreductase YuxK